MVWRFKRATLLTLISVSIAIIFTIISLFAIGSIKSFVNFIGKEEVFVVENGGLTIVGAGNLKFEFEGLGYDEILYFLWKGFLTLNIISLSIFIICLIFTILSFNDYKLNHEGFVKKKKIHTTYLVFLIISLITFLNNTLVIVYPDSFLVSLGYLAGIVIFIVSMVYAIKGIKDSKLLMFVPEKNNVINMENPNTNDYNRNGNNNSTTNTWVEERYSVDEHKDNTIKNEKPIINQEKLNDIYEHLARLEKSYKNGEISYEEYLSAKEDILKSLNN